MDLKPCPFCGSSAEVERYGNPRQSTIYVCDECGCRLETGEEWDHGARWNDRKEALRLSNELEEARDNLGRMAASADGHRMERMAEALRKDRLERSLHRAVCSGRVSLRSAQVRMEAWR